MSDDPGPHPDPSRDTDPDRDEHLEEKLRRASMPPPLPTPQVDASEG